MATIYSVRSSYRRECNSFYASGDVCRLLITFANSLDPDQARRFVEPDMDPNCLALWLYSWKIFSEKLIKKNPQTTKKLAKITQHAKSKISPIREGVNISEK